MWQPLAVLVATAQVWLVWLLADAHVVGIIPQANWTHGLTTWTQHPGNKAAAQLVPK